MADNSGTFLDNVADRTRYAEARRNGPSAGIGTMFNQTLPTQHALGRVLSYFSSSLCWASSGVYAPLLNETSPNYIEAQKNAAERKGAIEWNSPIRRVGTFRFLTSADNISITHSHKWDDGGTVSGALAKMVSGASAFSAILSGTTLMSRGVKTHKIASYVDTDLLTIEVPVTLFTFDNPIGDILIPIALLNYYTHPTRVDNMNGQDIMSNLMETIAQWKPTLGNTITLIKDAIGSVTGSAAGGKITEGIEREFKANYEIYSYVIPHMFDLSFSNHMVHLPLAAVTDMAVTYHGPWTSDDVYRQLRNYASNVNPQIAEIFGAVDKAGKAMESTKVGPLGIGLSPNIEEMAMGQVRRMYQWLNGKGIGFPSNNYQDSGYPTFAEVTLTFQALRPLFAQDMWDTTKNLVETYEES